MKEEYDSSGSDADETSTVADLDVTSTVANVDKGLAGVSRESFRGLGSASPAAEHESLESFLTRVCTSFVLACF